MSKEHRVYMFLSPDPVIQGILNYVPQPITTIFITIMSGHKWRSQANRKAKALDKKIDQKERKRKISNSKKGPEDLPFCRKVGEKLEVGGG